MSAAKVSGAQGESGGEDECVGARLGSELILPGGKVDPDAIRRAIEDTREGDEEDLPRVLFEISRDLNTRLDRYLTSRITFMSRTQLQRLIEGGGVTVNARAAKPSTRLGRGDVVEVVVPPPPDRGVRPEPIELDVLFEDEHLIVLNKHPDIIVHPARSELSGTMINALAWRFRNISGGSLSPVGEDFARPGVVHRLDRHTSGCIVFAKSEEAHWKLGRQFETRSVDKRYLAIVHGLVEPDVQVIDLPIGPHPSREKGYREKYVVRHDDLGKPSVTICRVRERYRRGGERFTLVELELKTGRTHQIRVHMSYNHWALAGDDMYGGRPFTLPGGGEATRQMLHAALLAFEHPLTRAPMVFTAPPPADFLEVVRALRTEEVERVEAPGVVALERLGLAESGGSVGQ